MSTTAPVVLGVDGRHDAPVLVAVDEARRRGTALRAVHCVGMPDDQVALYASRAAHEEMVGAGREVLGRIRTVVDGCASTVEVDYVLSGVPPVEGLLEEAASAQLLVIGIDDIPWYDRLVGAAAAEQLARHAACPVMVVPGSTRATGGPRDVVAALDIDAVPSRTLEAAFEQAELRRCRLHVLHVVPRGATEEQTNQARRTLDALLARAIETHPGTRLVTSLVADAADEACVRASEQAALLVVGRPRRPDLGHALSHPVALRVVRGSRSPVLVVPGVDTPG